MAGFDPDAYLAKKSGASDGFDPNAYLAAKGYSDDSAEIVEEMHPDLSTVDRLKVKNFGGSGPEAVGYLQKKNPGLQFRVDDITKEILAKKPEEGQWRKLDPDTGFFSTDFLRDAGDVAFDVLGGIGTSAATAAGGMAGAAAGGVGALPAAAAAGSASSTGIEALRQLVGQGLGVSSGLDPSNLAGAAVMGGLSPVLFGTGATASQAALRTGGQTLKALNPFAGAQQGLKNLGSAAADTLISKAPMLPEGLRQQLLAKLPGVVQPNVDETAKALLASQRGVPGRVWDSTVAKHAPAVGEWASGIHRDIISTFADDPAKIEKMGEQSAKELVNTVVDDVTEKVARRYNKIGQDLDAVYAIGDEAFRGAPPELRGDLSVSVGSVLEPLSDLKREITATKEAGLDTAATEAELGAIEDVLGRFFKGGELEDLPASVAFRLKKQLDTLASYSKKPGVFGHETGGMPLASQEMTLAVREMQQRINDELVKVTGNAFKLEPALAQRFPELSGDPNILRTLNAQWAQMRGEVQPFVRELLRNDHAAFRNLTNLSNRGNAVKLDDAKILDQLLGTDIAKGSKELGAVKAFTDPPWMAASSMGTTSTSRTSAMSDILEGAGYWAGANSGLGQGGAGIGKVAAGALGSTVGSPAALKNYMKANAAGRNANRHLVNSGLRPAQQILPWLHMTNRNQAE